MKELDFEELDKAVNSLLGDKDDSPASASATPLVPGSKTTQQQPVKTTITPTVVSNSTEPPAPTTPAATATPKTDESSIPVVSQRNMMGGGAAAAGRRAGGKFIDVVHPSKLAGDDKPPVSTKVPTIQPPTLTKPEPVKTEEKISSDASESTEEIIPDPIDFHGYNFKDAPKDQPKDEPKALADIWRKQNEEAKKSGEPKEPEKELTPDGDEVTPEIKTTEESSEGKVEVKTQPTTTEATTKDTAKKTEEVTEPTEAKKSETPEATPEEPAGSTSPFISDAKVEKRPLGAFSAFKSGEKKTDKEAFADKKANEASKDTESTIALPADAPAGEKVAMAEDEPLPPELDSDLAAIEAGGALEGSAEPKSQSTPPASEKPVEKTAKPEPPKSALLASQGHAIPKQYHTPEKPVDETPRPVFDTNEYHQPLLPSHTVHHKSKAEVIVTWILVVVLLLALLAGAYFAFIYFTAS